MGRWVGGKGQKWGDSTTGRIGTDGWDTGWLDKQTDRQRREEMVR